MYPSDIQKRREKIIKDIQKNNKDYSNKDYYGKNFRNINYISKQIAVKILVSLIMLIFIYFTYHSNNHYAKIIREFTNESLTREYNFQGLYKWYEKKFAGYPAILPTFAIKEKQKEFSDYQFKSPITKPPLNIKKTKLGIYIETVPREQVLAIEKGLVINVNNKNELGLTVIIRHPNGVESIYGLLKEVDVEQDQWVESGHVIGKINSKMYFAVKNQQNYLNPLEVVHFE